MADAAFTVAVVGPQVSVQDAGRFGMMRFGVPASGPMDRAAFAIANRVLGNPAGAAGVEVSVGGLTLDCVAGAVRFAVVGGGFVVAVDDQRGGSWMTGVVRAGQRLAIRPGPWGSWTCLAFAGQMVATDWLGSSATHALSDLGGGKLVSGAQITVRGADAGGNAAGLRTAAIPCPVWARPRPVVRLVAGPQDRFFDAEAMAKLLSEPFQITDAYDRMGVRLRGPTLVPNASLTMPSEPVVRGSVQVAGDGVATVLLADHQTTGGYPKIATVLDADLDSFVQLRPQDRIRFKAVGPDQAIAIARARRAGVDRYLATLTR